MAATRRGAVFPVVPTLPAPAPVQYTPSLRTIARRQRTHAREADAHSQRMSAAFKLPGWAAKPREPPTLLVFKDAEEQSRLSLSDKALLFGRKVDNAPERGTLRLDHDSISREHAVIVHAFQGEAFVCDLGSRYGTLVDGEKIAPRSYIKLHEGAKIQFGASTRRYVFTRLAPARPSSSSRAAGQASGRPSAASTERRPPDGAGASEQSARRQPRDEKATGGVAVEAARPADEEDEDPMANYQDDDESSSSESGDDGGMGSAAEEAEKKRLRRERKVVEKARRKALKAEMRAEEKERLRALGSATGKEGEDGDAADVAVKLAKKETKEHKDKKHKDKKHDKEKKHDKDKEHKDKEHKDTKHKDKKHKDKKHKKERSPRALADASAAPSDDDGGHNAKRQRTSAEESERQEGEGSLLPSPARRGPSSEESDSSH